MPISVRQRAFLFIATCHRQLADCDGFIEKDDKTKQHEHKRGERHIAIYHLEAKVISRGNGRSAVAAAAYASRSNLYNDYDGLRHDYSGKHDLLWQNIYLPVNAPTAWNNREQLWNAVEAEESTKDSRLAREFILALPAELDETSWKDILTEYIRDHFVQDGMCADVSIHCDAEGHNPHAHLLVTVRPLDEQGHWQYKTKKEYICIRDGVEQGFTASEYPAAKVLGWEKQYLFQVDKKKVYMTMEDGLAGGYKRTDKHPKSTKYGRQNPISARWNSEEQLLIWREQWAAVVNSYLEREGFAERIDHRSFAERGIQAAPTIHEGVVARALEAKGIVSDRCEINRLIKADNMKLTKEVYTDVSIATGRATVHASVPQTEDSTVRVSVLEERERIRDKLILIQYQLAFNNHQRDELETFLEKVEPDMNRYQAKKNALAVLKEQRKDLRAELANLGMLHPIQAGKLKKQIAEITEEMEDTLSGRNMILKKLGCADAKEANALKKQIASAHDTRHAILVRQPQLHNQRNLLWTQYRLENKPSSIPDRSIAEDIRIEHLRRVQAKLESTFGERFDPKLFERSVTEVDALISGERYPHYVHNISNSHQLDDSFHRKHQEESR